MRQIRWRFVGRYSVTDGTLSATNPIKVLDRNPNRVAFQWQNTGSADAWLSDDQTRLKENPAGGARGGGWTLSAGLANNPLTSPYAPNNELFATGAAGAIIEVAEAVWEDVP